MVRLVVSNSGHPSGARYPTFIQRPDASRVNKAVRGDVVDLAARSTDIH
jgi:hypothetical protein